jgi:hypothetical protein
MSGELVSSGENLMALTHEQYTQVDAQLQHVHEYLESLADQLCVTASPIDRCGHAHHAAVQAAEQVDELRYQLAVAEARRQVIEHRSESSPARATGLFALPSWHVDKPPAVKLDYITQ